MSTALLEREGNNCHPAAGAAGSQDLVGTNVYGSFADVDPNGGARDPATALRSAQDDGVVVLDSATDAQNDGGVADEDDKPLWKYLLSALMSVIMILVLALAMAVTVVPRVMGAVPLRVLSGSMEPRFSPGDLIVTRPVDANALRIGDIVTFQPVSGDPTLITHRITGITMDGMGNNIRFVTQGDANNTPDDPIIPEQVMGRVMYGIPMIGHLTGGENSFLVTAILGAGLLGNAIVLFIKPDKKVNKS